ncbi:hypothetical protein [Mycoplasma bradburyae]|uniref:hypothetical protein n=1 Tax=Mycoplasma bradburyae TaxID=2963128 RepID=UPI0020CFE597|nr:hypothetical protein [Mycoplasma bradburyae]UTS70551.1 hypothetical protein NMG77_02240 [Mycoplasma bradburyae]
MKIKKNILKIVSLLSAFSIVVLSATSCTGVKISETNPPSISPNQPTDPNPSNPEPTKPTMKDESNPSLILAKEELNNLLKTEDSNISLYNDYSEIKSKLQNAYNVAKSINSDSTSNEQSILEAKNTLRTAIDNAASEKSSFDSSKPQLVEAYKSLKNTLGNKSNVLNQIGDNASYQGLINQYNSLYSVAELIITNTLQANDLTKGKIYNAKSDIENFVSTISDKKMVSDEYLNFKKFSIKSDNFIGDFSKTQNQPENWRIVSFSSNLNNVNNKFAFRKIDKLAQTDNLSDITDVAWIYDLRSQEGKTASYDFKFNYYSGSNAVLYFPYKIYTTSQNSTNLGLQYKLNNGDLIDISSIISDAQIDDIKIAKINLTGLIFGENTISFSVPSDKQNPMIGNMYVAQSESEESINKIRDNIFANEWNENNHNVITVNLVKGYGIANKIKTNLTKFSGKFNDNEETKTYYLLGYLGSKEGSGNDSKTDRYYVFYLNAPTQGTYKISGFYNSGETRGLSFWKDAYNAQENGKKAKFNNLNSGNNNWTSKLKNFNEAQKLSGNNASLDLIKGLNKIIVSGKEANNAAPNLGNITFTLVQ